MTDSSTLELVQNCTEFQAIPPETHLFCPKLSEDDEEDYDEIGEPGEIGIEEKLRRIENGKHRLDLACRCSIILGFDDDATAGMRDGFKSRTGDFLTTCSVCVRNWHRYRRRFLKKLSESEPDAFVSQVEDLLHEFDSQRITHGLKSAEDFIKQQEGLIDQKTFIEENHADMLVALYEALCCIRYLSVPEHRVVFNYVFERVQEKRVLKLFEVLPTMTFFLFEEDKTRHTFAKQSWLRMPHISADDFEWAVRDSVADALKKVNIMSPTQEQSQRFWEGFGMILKTIGQEIVPQALESIDVQPNIYQTMLNHMATGSESNLAAVLRVFCYILRKAPRGLWGNFATFSHSSVAEQVFGSRAFRGLLSRTREFSISMPQDEYLIGPVTIAWVKPFVDSIPASQKGDACDSMLHHFLDDFAKDVAMSQEGRLACYSGAIDALLSTLAAFIVPSFKIIPSSSTIHTNRMLNLTLQHKEQLIGMATLSGQDPLQSSVAENARAVIGSALMLDTRVTVEEFGGFQLSDDRVQQVVKRNSSALWGAFVDLLHPGTPGAMRLAKTMLTATTPLLGVEAFRPKKHARLSRPKEEFNDEFRKTAEVIAVVIERLQEFAPSDIAALCSDPTTVRPIMAALINGEAAINEAALAFIKTVTDEFGRDDAIQRVLELYFSPVLVSFTQNIVEVTEGRLQLWAPQFPILHLSNSMLKALCDPATGILRTKKLDASEHGVMLGWWASQWAFINTAFISVDGWSKLVETETAKKFCSETMELADALLAQDGLVSSALGSSSAMRELMTKPRENFYGIVMMLRLRDKRLIEATVNSVTKILRRLAENGMSVPERSLRYIRQTCVKLDNGKFEISTNLNNVQRAELLRALGEDDEPEVVEVKVEPKKQTRIDTWSKSTDSVPSPAPFVLDLTKNVDTKNVERKSSLLDQFRSKHSKPETKTKPAVKSLTPKPPNPLDSAKLIQSRQREKEAQKKRNAEAIAKAKALRGAKPTVAGEGSGLQGLNGVLGKDHAPQRSEMMVNSSSEDEDDSDDDAFRAETEASKKNMEEAKQRVEGLKRQQKQLGPVKKTKIERTKKDMRARITPPMEKLHGAILDWDIFHEGNDPPNGVACSNVSNTYNDPTQYKATFFPLLIYEAWRSFVTAKDETTAAPFGIKVLNRMSVDKFIEVSTAMPMIKAKDRTKDQWLSEGDIVLLSTAAKPLESPNEAHCLARIWRTTFKNGNLETSYRLSGRAGTLSPLLNPGFELYAVKITNMTTIEREYASLESLQYFDLMPEVLEAKPSPMLGFGEENIRNVMTNYQLNQGQAKAILTAVENDAFTLIQGPPGTGKTKTIVAMVGALMTGVLSKPTGLALRPTGSAATPPKKLLVCAPSNAAVDELVLRLKKGVKTRNGGFHRINVLRLGRSDAINSAVKDVTLDELVKAQIEGDKATNGGPTDRQKMHEEAGRIKKELGEIRPRLEAARVANNQTEKDTMQRAFDDLKRQQIKIGRMIDNDKDSGNSAAKDNEIKKRQIQQNILNNAQVLCATLSGSGHDMFKHLEVEFETVIIDEAAQCIELSALIPLKYGCTKCILVGDPKQLPPTVLSQSAARYGYDQSLFVRMQRNHSDRVHLLDQQYRMHPEISQFPSQEFYEGRLYDGDDMAKLRHQEWHMSGLLGPYRFFDVKGSQERGRKGQSLVNIPELKVAMQLYDRFKLDNPRVEMKGKIGIITPYKAQLYELRDQFTRKYGDAILDEIEFNTTDAFQGRECEIIIFSCVRASPTGGIGFMTDIRRMNVGLTRARSSLWILGDSRALVQGEFWNKLIINAKERDRYTDGDVMALLRRPGVRHPNGLPPSAPPIRKIHEAPPPPQDVDMPDAPPMKPGNQRNKTAQLPQSYNVLQPRYPAAPPSGFLGLNERGETVAMPSTVSDRPTIHPAPQNTSGGQKRPREADGGNGPASKRHLPGPSIPPGRPRPNPIDPSALAVLNRDIAHAPKGPSKPSPSVANAPKGPSKPSPSVANAPKGPSKPRPPMPMPPRKKPASDPFIKRKPGKPR